MGEWVSMIMAVGVRREAEHGPNPSMAFKGWSIHGDHAPYMSSRRSVRNSTGSVIGYSSK